MSNATPQVGFSFGVVRLPPPHSFVEANALVEAALGQLRNTEAVLERQLSELRCYIASSSVPGTAYDGRDFQQ